MTMITVGAALPTQLESQRRPRTLRPPGPPQHQVGGGVTLIQPVGEFGDVVDFGGGLGAFGVIGFNRSGSVGLRFDGSVVLYGHETVSVPLTGTGRVHLDAVTSNFIAGLGVGPQVTLGSGPIRPYGYAVGGFSYFATESSLRGSRGGEEFASTTNFDDFTFTVGAGGGLLIRISNGGNPVSLDLGATFQDNGRTQYLREGGIVDLPGGNIALQPFETQTDLVQYRVGISVGID
ncbi:MAG: hypothetical protein ACE5FJ_02120 [Gemmatimonadales bacterium]